MGYSCHRQPGPRRRDGPWAWLVLVYAFTCALMAGGLGFSYGVLLPTLMAALDANRQQTALVGSLEMGLALFLCVAASRLCERLTCRITNGIGIICYAVGLILSSIAKSVYPLYITYSVLIGIGGACMYCACFIAIRQYFDKHYALAMGLTAAGAGTGVLSFGPFIHLLISIMDWRNTFRVLACIYILLLFFTFIYDPDVEKAEAEDLNRGPQGVEDPPHPTPGKGMFDLSVWTFPEFTVAVVSIFISNFGHYTPYIHLVKYSEEKGLSASAGSLLFVFIGVSTIVSRVVAGRLCDVSVIRPRHVNQAAAALSGIATILLTLASTFTHLMVFAVAYGLADGAYRVTLNILFMNTVDSARGPSAFGQANMVTSVSNIAGPAIAGLLADRMGTYVSAFYMAGSVTLIGAAVLSIHFCCFATRTVERPSEILVNSPPLDTGPAELGVDNASIQDTRL